MKTLKERVKRWVSREKGGVATTSNVKKHYKWFRATNPEHWQKLAMMMMPDIFPDIKEPSQQPKKDMSTERYQQLVKMTDYMRVTYGVIATSWDFAGRCTCDLQHQGMRCGYIGWLESRQSWVYATRIHTITCDSLQAATDRFLAMNPDIF